MDFLIFIAAVLAYMGIGSFMAGLVDDTSETIAIYVFFWPLMLAASLVIFALACIVMAIKRIFKK